MDTTTRTNHRRARLGTRALALAAGLTLTLALSSCGSSSGGDDGIASVEGTSAEPSDSTTTTVDPEEGMLQFTQCMRDHGIDMPDPSSDGGQVLLGGDDGELDLQSDEFQEAQAACEDLLPDMGSMAPGDVDELQDQLREVAACMRDRGFDVPDPVVMGSDDSKGSGPDAPGGEPSFDPNDPDFQEAQRACSEEAGVEAPGSVDGVTP